MPAADASNPIEAVRARLDGGRKWRKGTYQDTAGNMCLIGACVAIDAPLSIERILLDVVAEQYPDRAPLNGTRLSIEVFNDHGDTEWPDVDLVLDKAARRWDEQVTS